MSDGEAALADSWSKITSDPALKDRPDLASTFMEKQVEPFISVMQAHASTRAGKEYALQTGDRIRQTFWRSTAADQATLTANTVHENTERVGNNATVSVARDPSQVNYDAQSKQIVDTADTMASAIPTRPGEVDRRTEWHDEYVATHMRDMTIARYQGMAASISQDVAQTGDETKSAAYADATKTYAGDTKGADWVKGQEWVELGKGLDQAVRQGKELYTSKRETAKTQLTDAGKADYAKLHNVITNLALNGQGPTPELIDAASDYAKRYGATNPGEVASLDDFIMRGQERAQSNAVQPFDQKTRDNIQAGFSAPAGDPRRPTLASLTKAYSHGQITKEDLSGYTEILGKLDKPETDPGFKPAWESFVRWRDMQVQGIGGASSPGTGAARAAFIHDVTANFMARGKSGDWGKALNGITDIRVPGSFGKADMMAPYQKAAQRPDAANWLKDNWYQWNENGTATKAHGSTAAPVYPTGNTPQQPTKIDQATVDKIRGL